MNANELTFGIEIETVAPQSAVDEEGLRIGAYHHGIQVPYLPQGWKAERDGSIDASAGRQPCEIVSPVLREARAPGLPLSGCPVFVSCPLSGPVPVSIGNRTPDRGGQVKGQLSDSETQAVFLAKLSGVSRMNRICFRSNSVFLSLDAAPLAIRSFS